MISQYRPNVSFTLVRNPYFRQWSYAAQPAGYPNVIRFDQVAGPAKHESAVIAGRADVTDVYSGNGQSLATRYPARVHTTLKLATEYLFLNTRLPPFTSLKARQAVSYAIDRGRILQLRNLAPGQAVVTCQILPADFPGHQGYCPYTTGTKDGIWHSPDMAKARRLAKDSHTTNVPVTVWILKDFASRALDSYLVQVLKDLGYRAQQRTVPGNRFFPAVGNFQSKVQAGFNAWGADFPTASEFFLPVLSCRSFYQDPTNTQLCRVLRPARRPAGQPGAGGTAHRPRRRAKAVGPGGSHRHRPGTMGPDPQPRIHRIRLRPDRELPGVPHFWAPVRPDVGPVGP